ncbi:MAG: DNA-binding protein [Cyanobacteria bacterium P01_A01_bin.83]
MQKGRVRGAYKTGKFWLIPLYNGLPYVEKTRRGQAGTWKTVKKPQKTTININSNRIKQNIKKSKTERQPAIAVKGKEKHYVHELEIPVPCKIIYNPDKPLDCGARVWIEILNFDLDLIAS